MRQLAEAVLDALALESEPGRVLGGLGRGDIVGLVERLRPASLLAAHEVDGAPMDERQDPRGRLRPLGPEAGCRAPHAEEGFLHGVLGEPVVPEHPEREAVRHPADAVVELGQRSLVVARDERHEGLVREMSEVPAHGPGVGRVAQRYHGERVDSTLPPGSAPEPFPVRLFGLWTAPIAAVADSTEPPSPIGEQRAPRRWGKEHR